jgi:hypothetical protein
MSEAEYRDKFIELSRHAPEEVADDPKKQERFMEGLAGPLQYQLTSHTFSSFQHLLDKAITLESEDHVWFEDRWMVASWCDE